MCTKLVNIAILIKERPVCLAEILWKVQLICVFYFQNQGSFIPLPGDSQKWFAIVVIVLDILPASAPTPRMEVSIRWSFI